MIRGFAVPVYGFKVLRASAVRASTVLNKRFDLAIISAPVFGIEVERVT
jgi:hypothetical protein